LGRWLLGECEHENEIGFSWSFTVKIHVHSPIVIEGITVRRMAIKSSKKQHKTVRVSVKKCGATAK
jgi:hypothetical protein